jgi:DNA polymerase-3 subunit alpha
MAFTHLHNHTEYSMLDGLSRIKSMVGKAKGLGMDSLAITDHGGLYGVVDFYQECLASGIRPIIGVEAYVAQKSRLINDSSEKNPRHLTLLAKSNQGYSNLMELITKANLEGFYYKPRIDRELLERHGEGLIVMSGCPSAEIPQLIIEERLEEAWEAALWFRDTFPDFYIELQQHDDLPFLDNLNHHLLALSKDLSIPLVATNDCHYVDKEDAHLQDILICVQTNTTVEDEKRLKMSDDSYYLRPSEEMEELFQHLPEALENTQRIAEMCYVDMDFSTLHMPQYTVPEMFTAHDYLEKLCWDGLKERRGEPTPEDNDRLRYELDVIGEIGLANYFLVVWDIAAFARNTGILMGVRGSAAASMVLYCLEITDIYPLEYRLVFERFLNRERREMPDIDMDFQDDRREEVIDYVVEKYGKDHVAQIITFGTLGAKAALRDVGRALAMPYGDVDQVARLIPTTYLKTEQAEIKAWSIEEALNRIPEFKAVYDQDEALHNLIDTAQKMEGITRHVSTHAAGVVISEAPLTTYVPLQRPVRADNEGIAMTQFSMVPIAKLGLLKMDFLGLTNLTIVAKTLKLIEDSTGQRIDLREIPLDDKAAYDLLGSAETVGVFQLEGSGMRRYIKDMKPASVRDLAAMIALYRPGPMEHIETYIRASKGLEAVQYPHPDLATILEETHGVIVYQDQVLLILQAFAGYSLGGADIVRKAMGKKNADLMRQEKQKFLDGAQAKGYSPEAASDVFGLIEPFAGYAFNKAHAVSYALIAYWTAFFKATYKVEYMTAMLTAHLGNTEKAAAAIAECIRLKIPIMGPDINQSDSDFTVERNEDGERGIRFGLAAIKNVGASAVAPLVEARAEGGPFLDIEDFCRRSDLHGINKRTLESLVKVGALDSFGQDRGTLVANVNRIVSLAQEGARLRDSGQTTMFDLFGDSVPTPIASLEMEEATVSAREKLAWEKELLGVYLSENPLIAASHNSKAIITRGQIVSEMVGKKVNLVAQVSSFRRLTTKEGRPFLAVQLEFLDGSLDLMVWADVYERTQGLWQEGAFVSVVGTVKARDDELSISCHQAQEFSLDEEPAATASEAPGEVPHVNGNGSKPKAETESMNASEYSPKPTPNGNENGNYSNGDGAKKPGRWVTVRLQESSDPEQDRGVFQAVLQTLLVPDGSDLVRLEIAAPGKNVLVEMEHVFTAYTSELCENLEQMLGAGSVRLEESA